MQYKPKDIERRFYNASLDYSDYGGKMTTKDIQGALVDAKPQFDNAEYNQFIADKNFAQQLGELYDY